LRSKVLIDKPGVSHDVFTFLRNVKVHNVFARVMLQGGKLHPVTGREGPEGK